MSGIDPEKKQEPRREDVLFAAALKRPSGERAAFLDGACHGDPALRLRLDALLGAHEGPDDLLTDHDDRIRPTIRVDDSVDEALGTRIGRYKLLQKLGEGGCGVVYMADQEEPVRRRVAVKVIKLGMDTKSVVARFEAERQALALMDHPNIARVLDAGTTEKGRPYFVMELVRGIRITDYCDKNHLATEARLDLFITVCRAVQHAHQKGIIHRDIKPSNILVTLHDGVPVPKVIDFGIAKATEQKLTDKTLFTELHQFIGTPAYMSPEQAEMSGLDIDGRSDIYSLGVLLYELLTGRTPFDSRELIQSGLDAIRRTIREVEPARPSTRLSTLSDADLDTVAKARGTGSLQLRSQLQGDLDWIVMKALEKDRTRRYEDADSFAQDLQRHLADKPVSAVAPSFGYRFGKFVRRNKAVLGVTASLTLLAGGLLVSVCLLVNQWLAGRHGGITVNTDPEGAEVWQDGKRVGTTPFERSGIPLGDFVYRLVLNNYESVTNTITLLPGKQIMNFIFLRRMDSSRAARMIVPSDNVGFSPDRIVYPRIGGQMDYAVALQRNALGPDNFLFGGTDSTFRALNVSLGASAYVIEPMQYRLVRTGDQMDYAIVLQPNTLGSDNFLFGVTNFLFESANLAIGTRNDFLGASAHLIEPMQHRLHVGTGYRPVSGEMDYAIALQHEVLGSDNFLSGVTNFLFESTNFTFAALTNPRGTSDHVVEPMDEPLVVQQLAAAAPRGATILTMAGKVEVARKGGYPWMTAQTNMLLSVGDRVRTASESRVSLRLSDFSVVWLNEYSILQIENSETNKWDKPILNLKNGMLYFFHGGKGSNSTPRIRTPSADAQIRG